MKKTITLLSILITGLTSPAQQAAIRIDTLITQPGNDLLIPVYFSGFENVGAITLYLSFPSSTLTFKHGINWYGAFDNGFNFANASGNILSITCLNYTGVTQSSGKLLDLKMNYGGSPGLLQFLTGCEITDAYGIPLTPPPLFQSGLITRPLAATVTAPTNQVCLGDSVRLHATAAGGFGDYQYAWSSIPPGFASSLPDPWVTPDQTTLYRVSITDGILGDTASIQISPMNPEPPGQAAPLLPQEGDSGLLNPVSFSWNPSPGALTYSIFIWPAGTTEPPTPAASGPGLLNYTPTEGLTEGVTYLWRVDAANACLETPGEPGQFSMMPLPNLRISLLEISQPAAGQVMQVTWTVRNDGEGPTTTPVWYDKIWISENLNCADVNWNTILLGQYPNISALNPGESYTQTKNIILPEHLYGNYFVFAITDAMDVRDIQFNGPPPVPYTPPPFLLCWSHNRPNDQISNRVKEAGEEEVLILDNYQDFAWWTLGYYHDNFFYVPAFLEVPPIPDLVVTQVIAPNSTFSGQTVSLTYTVANQGEVSPVQQFWKDKIYLSTDTVFSETSSLLLKTVNHHGTLFPDSSYTHAENLLIPAELFGTFYFFVVTDATGAVFEHVYNGNNTGRSDSMTVYLTPPPDLVVQEILIPESFTPGGYMDVKYTVTNQGASAPTVNWRDRIYISDDSTFDSENAISVGFAAIQQTALPPGGSYTRNAHCNIPKNLNGPCFIYVITDSQEEVFELDMEDNNLTRSDTIQLLNPDLSADAFSIPEADTTDQVIPVQFLVRNNGPGDLRFHRTKFRLSLCQEAVFNPEDQFLIAEIIHPFALQAGATRLITGNISLPDVNSGYYYLYIETDADNLVYEPGHEDNNITRSENSIYVGRADLQVARLETAPSVLSGMPFVARATLKNTGTGRVEDTLVTNRITFSLTPQADPGNDREMSSNLRQISLFPGDSLIVEDTFFIPPGMSGNWFITHATDWTDVVKEGDQEANNVMTREEPLLITPGPVPDLQLFSFDIPDTVTAGIPFEAVLTVKNAGDRSVLGQSWQEKVFWSVFPAWIEESFRLAAIVEKQPPLLRDSLHQIPIALVFPDSITAGTHYLHVFLDAGDSLYERTGEDNNQAGPFPVVVGSYPLDLAVTRASAGNDTLGAGTNAGFEYVLKNNSSVPVTTGTWQDAIYLSEDEVFNPEEDLLLGDWTTIFDPGPGDTMLFYRQILIPPGTNGDYYLLLVCDHLAANPDTDRNNNYRTIGIGGQNIPVHVTQLPSPDFSLTALQVPAQAFTNHDFQINWTVTNTGDTAAMAGWKDKFYLSSDNILNTGDIQLAQRAFSASIMFSPGQSYADSLTIPANPAHVGNYWVIALTDAEDQYYEPLAEGNNTAAGLVLFRHAPPVDLQITQAAFVPDPGGQAGISWTLLNSSGNPVSGTLKDGIYLSADSLFSNDDPLWFTLSRTGTLAGGASQARDTVAALPGLTSGDYYLIIRTDVNQAFQETDETNNLHVSGPYPIDVPELFLDLPVSFVMENVDLFRYKLVVPDSLAGETFVLHLAGDSLNGFNEIYASYEQIPDRIRHDFAHAYFMQGNQELYIPELEAGTYYFLVAGTTLPEQNQDITLLGSILDYEIRAVDQDKGGSPGSVTVMIYGSKFTPQITFFLARDSVLISASRQIFLDATKMLVTFTLSFTGQGTNYWSVFPLPYGLYDVMAVKSNGDTALLEDGFEIVPFTEPVLLENLEYPPYVRPNVVFYMSLQFINNGDTDIPVPRRTLLSLSDAAIALASKDLQLDMHDLFLEFREPGGPEDVLRPGARCDIRIFCRSGARGSKLYYLLTE